MAWTEINSHPELILLTISGGPTLLPKMLCEKAILVLKTTLFLAFALYVSQCNASIHITYPKKGDLVNVYNGLPVTWSYNSSDSILLPLTIEFVPISHMVESPTYVREHLNITLGLWTIETSFPVAESYNVLLIYANDYSETGHFQISTSEQSKNASDTSTSSSSNQPSTSILKPTSTSSTMTGSINTETSSLAQETTSVLDSGATATAATTRMSSSVGDNDNGSISTGSKVGIGIGCVAAAIIGIVGIWLAYRIKKKRNLAPELQNSPGFDSENLHEIGNSKGIFEADGKQEAANMPELSSGSTIYSRSELPG